MPLRSPLVALLLVAWPALCLAEGEPAAVPSGMDLLYSDRVAFKPSGEPIVTIGLMDGQRRVAVHSDAELQVDFYEEGIFKRSVLPAKTPVTFALRRAEPATRQAYVDVGGVAWAERDTLEAALNGWRAKGYADVRALEEGTVLGMAGRVIDNRMLRVILPAGDLKAAQQIADAIYARFGERAAARTRLVERPWGEITTTTSLGPLGVATSFVRLVALPAAGAPATSAHIGVDDVEYGRGYAWHGRQTRSFAGELYVAIDPNGTLAVVNVIGAEDVLKGVVPSELFADAPAAALRAQAVAARNHLFAKLGRRHHGDPFHLCSEQHCQVYTGVARQDPRTDAAVEATWGEALFHEHGLVHAVYSSTCGGHTEDNDAVWGDRADPALRGRPDFDVAAQPTLARFSGGINEANIAAWLSETPPTYCSQASFAQKRLNKFRWRRRFDAAALRAALGSGYGRLGRLRDLRVRERGHGGKVVSLELIGERDQATVLMELPIRRLFDNLNSGTFIIEKERERGAAGALRAVTFVGAGWGHGVGMCQLGAIGRAEAGQTHPAILAHYYSGATTVRLYPPP